jgi:hypothetical protein
MKSGREVRELRSDPDSLNRLSSLLYKRLFGVKKDRLDSIINESQNDFVFYQRLTSEYSKIKHFPFSPQKRALSRFHEIKSHIPSQANVYLDIGSGDCTLPEVIGKMANSKITYATDLTPCKGENVTFFLSKEFQPFPLETSSVNLITVFQVFHHMKDLDFKLKEIVRVMDVNCLLVFREHDSNPKLEPLIDIEHALYDVVIEKKEKYHDFVNNYYAKYMSKKELNTLLVSLGLELKEEWDAKTKDNPTEYYFASYTLSSSLKVEKEIEEIVLDPMGRYDNLYSWYIQQGKIDVDLIDSMKDMNGKERECMLFSINKVLYQTHTNHSLP